MYIPCHFLFSFIRSLSQFHNFVDPIKADGGGDTPEDIMGALKITLSTSLSWRPSATKVLKQGLQLLQNAMQN